MKPSERRHARESAVQAMYQWQMNQTSLSELEYQFLSQEIRKKTDIEYFKELIHAIPKKIDELNEIMTPFLSRPVTEVDPVELSILYVAIYELQNRLDIPYRVVINEALELTKRFGSIEGFKFVNGVLDQVARHSRQIEKNAEKK